MDFAKVKEKTAKVGEIASEILAVFEKHNVTSHYQAYNAWQTVQQAMEQQSMEEMKASYPTQVGLREVPPFN